MSTPGSPDGDRYPADGAQPAQPQPEYRYAGPVPPQDAPGYPPMYGPGTPPPYPGAQPPFPYPGAQPPFPYTGRPIGPKVFDTSQEPVCPSWVVAAHVLGAIASVLCVVLAALPLFFGVEDGWVFTVFGLVVAIPTALVTGFLYIRPGKGSQITAVVYWSLWALGGVIPAAVIPILLLAPTESRDYFDHWAAIRREFAANGLT